MEITVVLADKENFNIIKNLYPLYLHDLSEIYGNVPNEYGIYEDEPIKTLIEQYDVQDEWIKYPDRRFPFIIMVDNMPAGFTLVSTKPMAPKGVDNFAFEMFLLRPYRGKNIAEEAITKIFDKFTGKWELYTNPTDNNIRGQKFWRKVVKNYTNGNYEECFGKTFDGDKLIFRFER